MEWKVKFSLLNKVELRRKSLKMEILSNLAEEMYL